MDTSPAAQPQSLADSITIIITTVATVASIVGNIIQGVRQAKLKRRKSEIESKLPIEHTYTLVVDGAQDAGKSMLIQKLINPGGPIVEKKSSAAFQTDSWPVVWKKGANKRELYCIKAQDIAAEKSEAVANLSKDIEKGQGVIVVVIDAKNVKAATDKFTRFYIRGVFAPKDMLERINAAIVYINKLDLIELTARDQFKKDTRKQIEDMLSYINELYPNTDVIFGSAKTEENLFQLLAEIHRRIGISDHFQNHPDAAGTDSNPDKGSRARR